MFFPVNDKYIVLLTYPLIELKEVKKCYPVIHTEYVVKIIAPVF